MKAVKAFLISIFLFGVSGCGGGSSSNAPPLAPTVTVSVSPSSGTLLIGQAQQFTATVSGTSNFAVTWQVNGITGGSLTLGTISPSGLYTAPGVVPSPPTVSVTAFLQADPSKSGSATVTITSNVTVSVSPLSATVLAGATQQFTAAVQNTSNTAVIWQVNGITGGNSTAGTITSSGLYTAPVAPAAGGAVTITAESVVDASKSGSAVAQIVFSNATLNGQYAFSAASTLSEATVGSFQADGKGNISGGMEDFVSSTGTFRMDTFTGTYSVGPDGRGSAVLSASSGTVSWQFIVFSPSSAALIEFDGARNLTAGIQQQDPSAFSTSALTGSYVFLGNSGSSVTVGLFTADGAGNLAGKEDANIAGRIISNAPLTGTYSVSSNGRGTASLSSSLGTSNLVFYVVSANEVVFIDNSRETGTVLRQISEPFSNTSLFGNYVFFSAGTDTLGSMAEVGILASDGAGILTGVVDENSDGTITQNTSFTGTYSIDSAGRGTATLTSPFGNSHEVFYLAGHSLIFVIETDPDAINGGLAIRQLGNPFSTSSIAGSFGFFLSGLGPGGVVEDIVGQVTANGSGTFTGTEDKLLGTTTQTGVALDGSYAISSNGRGTAQLTTSSGTTNLIVYVVSPGSVVLLDVDSGQILTGFLGKQF